MSDYPAMISSVDHIEPVPRRIRAMLDGKTVLDTTKALYLWEWEFYPQYYIPLADVNQGVLVDEDHEAKLRRGTTKAYGLRSGEVVKRGAARLYTESDIDAIVGHLRFEWNELDSWFEEDEEVFVHPRSPYVRVDALRSTSDVRIELNGLVLAHSTSPVLVFETGLPTRYYVSKSSLNFEHLIGSKTVTSCPYKGNTSEYWSVRSGETVHKDLAWSYGFPTRQLLPIAGLVAFYNEAVDIYLDNELLERPSTHLKK
jgi:uncharacterized protein (DUF427 family)